MPTWDSASDWEQATTRQNVVTDDGTVRMGPAPDGFETYSLEIISPGPWTAAPNTSRSQTAQEVDNAHAYGGSQSYYIYESSSGSDYSSGDKILTSTAFAQGEVNELTFRYYETSTNTRTAVAAYNESGDPILYVGTNNPQVSFEDANGYLSLVDDPSPSYGAWREFNVTLDYVNNQFDVFWTDLGGSTADASFADAPMINTPSAVSEVAVTYGGDATEWGGNNLQIWVDDVSGIPYQDHRLVSDFRPG